MGIYKGRHFIRRQAYYCGDYLEVSVFPVFQKPGQRRKKSKPTSNIQKRLNQKRAEMHITRIAHLNFTENDIAVHLTYKESPTIERAGKDVKNFLARIRRKYKKMGKELKYMATTEHGGRSGRIHVHMIINSGLDRDEIEKLWGLGYANTRRLQFNEEGITGLTKYMIKQRESYRRCSHSKNLVMPEPETDDGVVTSADMREMREAFESKNRYEYFEREYPGYTLVRGEYEKNVINYGDYCYVFMVRTDALSKVKRE